MDSFLLIILGLGGMLLMLACVIWLKGTFGFVRELSRATWERRGEQWVQYALLEPILFLPFAFVAAAFRLAHAESLWARWFYSDERRDAARARYSTFDTVDEPTDRRSETLEVN